MRYTKRVTIVENEFDEEQGGVSKSTTTVEEWIDENAPSTQVMLEGTGTGPGEQLPRMS